MDESFDISLTYKGEELVFPARLQHFGYTHQFAVDVYGQEILFEPDEERNYRVMIDPGQLDKNQKIDIELLKAIAKAIEAILK